MRLNVTRVAALAILALPTLNTGVYADEIRDSSNLRPEILRVNTKKIESLGLYETPNDGSLGRDLWDNTRRSFLMEYMPRIPQPDIGSPEHQRLVMGLLLSKANADLVEEDAEFVPGKDILTLRLQKLMDVGAYKQAFTLYSSLGEEPYHPELAQAGITAMLFNGERSLACLEYKTVQDRDFQAPIWSNISAYCHYVMGDEGGDDGARATLKNSDLPILRSIAANDGYNASYSQASFDKMETFERAVLAGEKRINWPAINSGTLKAMPNAYLGMLVSTPPASKADQFEVLIESARRGIVGPTILGKFYTQVFDEDLRQLDNPQNLGWKQLPYSYVMAKKSKNEKEKWGYLSNALPLMDNYGAASFIPFGDLLQTMDVYQESTSVMGDAVRIVKASGINFPGKWTRYYTQNNPQNKFESKMRVLAKIMSTTSTYNSEQDTDINDYFKNADNNTKYKYFNIIENLDKAENNIHNANEIYGNDFGLTSTERYVMPMPSVWDRLVNSSQSKRIGETVLLSTVILHQQSLGEMYPGLASDVLQTFNTVGLTKTSRALAFELILDQQ